MFRQGKLNKGLLILLASLLTVLIIGCGGGGGGDDGGDDSTPGATVTLSGSISAPVGVMIDGDTNDPNENYTANNSFGTAQSIPNPISVGGYVNNFQTGAVGESYYSGDVEDYFQVNLNAGDNVLLSIGDPETGDLDLFLYDDQQTQVASSEGIDRYEYVSVNTTGPYYIKVMAYEDISSSSASNYILTVGAASTASVPADTLSTQHDFMTGQAIIRFKESVLPADASKNAAERASDLGLTFSSGAMDREMLVTFDDSDPQAEVYQALGVTKALSGSKAADDDSEIARKKRTLRVIQALREQDDIRYAEPNYILHHCATEPDDEYYNLQWHYPMINLPQAWDYTTGDSGVIVAVIDTGVLMNHPDLAGQLTNTGYDFISDTSISNDGNGIDSNPDDPGDATTGGSSFHGTHCAGTVAAATNNAKGMAGVAWNTKIMPVRVLGVGGGTLNDIVQGIRYAAGLSNNSGTTLSSTQRADIISMSLGGGGYSQATQDVITAARNAGVIIIAAAGNESSSTPSYPASYNGVISVSAVNINSGLASYSNYGAYIDVAAPGGDSGDYNGDGYADKVWSTCADDTSGSIVFNYAAYNGTSMATPHMAGVVALMKAINPAMTPSQLDSLLISGDITNDIGAAGKDTQFGYGLIDALKAVVAAGGGGGGTTTVATVDPTSVNLGTSGTSATVTVSKIGTEAITVNSPTDDADWLTVTTNSVNAEGLGTYTIQANRGLLTTDGTYRGTVTFVSSENTVTVQVNLQVQSASASYTGGYHYVLLVDANSYTILSQYNVQDSSGSYAYTFTGVPQNGSYYIVAGSDRDNDAYIDNAAECVGAYPSVDQLSAITASSNLSGLNFPTDLKLSISTSGLSADTDEPLPRFMRLR